ncbi:MAG: hypothetical protein NVSMB62_16010 [Acidobacteriaceae bacterium]
MIVWSRRLFIFALVLTAWLLAAHTARRLTAHAATRSAAAHSMTGGTPAGKIRGSSGWITAPVIAAATPPAMKAPVTPSFSTGAPRRTLAASFGAPASIVPVPVGTHTFHDKNYKISFDYPANWTFTQRDHEISTFRLDARKVDRKTMLRAVTAIPENPYPASTFTGAYVYLSVTPHSNEQKCAQQASAGGANRSGVSRLGGMSFVHGHDEQHHICTVERDEIYTTYRKGACYRFDLAINNFCGGEVSGVKDVTEEELENVRSRMEAIVSTVRFDPK